MNYSEADAYLCGRLNYEQRGAPDADALRLDRVARLLQLLGDPHRRYKVAHVAGTKGKGSTAHFLAALLVGAGFRTGLHTSPHLECIEERMLVDGVPPSREEFVALVREIRPHVTALDAALVPHHSGWPSELTFFEIATAVVFRDFHRRAVDWAVVEVGMGGRLDATNVVSPEVAVITPIALDHVKTLGATIELIAAEKAGIIKTEVPVVSSALHPDASAVIRRTADAMGCKLYELNRDFHVECRPIGISGSQVDVHTWRGDRRFQIKMIGRHQAENAATAVAAYDALVERRGLPEPAVRSLRSVHPAARLEVLCESPLVILDTAHNEASASALVATLKTLQDSPSSEPLSTIPSGGSIAPRVLIFGATSDKDWPAMLRLFAPYFSHLVLTQYRNNLRFVAVDRLTAVVEAELADKVQWSATEHSSDAWQQAWSLVSSAAGDSSGRLVPNPGWICVAGSFFLAAEIRPMIEATLKAAGLEFRS